MLTVMCMYVYICKVLHVQFYAYCHSVLTSVIMQGNMTLYKCTSVLLLYLLVHSMCNVHDTEKELESLSLPRPCIGKNT